MITPYWQDDQVTLYHGDCLKVLAEMEAGSVDAIVTDPPYGLEFMGREWDSFKPSEARIRRRTDARTNPAEGKSETSTPEAYIAGQPYQKWCEQWARECLRVLKPGGHLLAFGGTRTSHRLTSGIEDAGFEIRDVVADLTGYDAANLLWLYAQGFPKSLDVSKAIDRELDADRPVVKTIPDRWAGKGDVLQRATQGERSEAHITASATAAAAAAAAAAAEGWGTALKPAHEPIVVARKPLVGTVAQNFMKHRTGALNVAECRVEPTGESRPRAGEASQDMRYADQGGTDFAALPGVRGGDPAGRWPPNVLLGPEAAAELDRQSGVLTSGANPARRGSDKFRDAYGEFAGQRECEPARGADSGGASRFFPVFRYQAKATAAERPRLADGTAHPTVKPRPLIGWLVRLITPPGGTVLDLFAGSGPTAEACIIHGFRSVLIEQDEKSCELIRERLRRPIQRDLFGGAA